MERLNISLPVELQVALDRQAKAEHTRRSTLIQKAIRFYLEVKKKRKTYDLLCEGYQEMYGVAKELQEDFKFADGDAFKDGD